VRGASLNELIGQEFEVQGARYFGVEECSPRSWMNSALGPGTEQWLRGRAGLRCRMLTPGALCREARPVGGFANWNSPADITGQPAAS